MMKKLFLALIAIYSSTIFATPYYQKNLKVSDQLVQMGVPADRAPAVFWETVREIETWKEICAKSLDLHPGIWPHPRTIEHILLAHLRETEKTYPAAPLSKIIWSFFPTQDGFELNSISNDPIKELTIGKIARLIGTMDKTVKGRSIQTPLDAEQLYTDLSESLSKIWGVSDLDETEELDEHLEKTLFIRNAEERISLAFKSDSSQLFSGGNWLYKDMQARSLRSLDPKNRTYQYLKTFNPSLFQGSENRAPQLVQADFDSLDEALPSTKEVKAHKKRVYIRTLSQALVDAHIEGVLNEQGVVQKTLLAYMAKRFSKPGRLKVFYSEYMDEIGMRDQKNSIARLNDDKFDEAYSKEWYKAMKTSSEETPATFWEMTSSERKAFSNFHYKSVYPWILDLSTTTIFDQKGKPYSFSDCGETAVRAFCMQLSRLEGEARYDASIFPNGSPARAYFTKYDSDESLETQGARDAWATRLAFLPPSYYVTYLKKTAEGEGYEISPHLPTFHNLLGYLFGKSEDFYLENNAENAQKMEDNINQCLSQIKLNENSYEASIYTTFPSAYINLFRTNKEEKQEYGEIELGSEHAEFSLYKKEHQINPLIKQLYQSAPSHHQEEAAKLIAPFVRSLEPWYELEEEETLSSFPVSALAQFRMAGKFLPGKFFVPSATDEQRDYALRVAASSGPYDFIPGFFSLQHPNNTFFDPTYIDEEHTPMWKKLLNPSHDTTLSVTFCQILCENPYGISHEPRENDTCPSHESMDLLKEAQKKGLNTLLNLIYSAEQSLDEDVLKNPERYTGIQEIEASFIPPEESSALEKIPNLKTVSMSSPEEAELLKILPDTIQTIILHTACHPSDAPSNPFTLEFLKNTSPEILEFLKKTDDQRVLMQVHYTLPEKQETQDVQQTLQESLEENNIEPWRLFVEFKLNTPGISIEEEDGAMERFFD